MKTGDRAASTSSGDKLSPEIARLPLARPAMPIAAQTIHLSAFDWDGATHHFRNDGQPVDRDARNALYEILRSNASPQLEIIAPPGIINLGETGGTSGICIQRGNVVLRGAGKNATRFVYTSALVPIPTRFLSGSGIIVAAWDGHGGWTRLHGVTLRDFEIEDLNPNTASGNGTTTNSPSGIFGYAVDAVELLDLRVVNAKGNAQVTFNGQTDAVGPVQRGFVARGVDLLGDPARPGRFAEGDGFNIGSIRDVQILGGSIVRVVRHAFEGGTPGRDLLVDGVSIDQQGQGFSGINPTGYADVRIVNCHISGIAFGWYGVDFTDDPGARAASLHNLIVQHNIVERGGEGRTRSIAPLRFQTIGAPSLVGDIDVSHNLFRGGFEMGLLIGPNDAPSGIIAYNDFADLPRGATLINRVSDQGSAPAAGDTLIVEGNRIGAGVPVVRFGNVSEWKNSRYLRVRGNVVGRTLADAAISPAQYGALTRLTAGWAAGSLAPATVSPPISIKVLDATPGDAIRVHYDAGWPGPLVEVLAQVTAPDTVICHLRNHGDTAVPIGAAHGFYLALERG